MLVQRRILMIAAALLVGGGVFFATRLRSNTSSQSIASPFPSARVILTANQSAQPPMPPSSISDRGGPLIHCDFNASDTWPQLTAVSTLSKTSVHAASDKCGTIDVANSTNPSGAVRLTVDKAASKSLWTASMVSGLLPVKTKETNLGKLTLSFDHSVSSVRPVTVQIESFDAKKKRTGGLETMVYPAAPDFYIRAAIDLSTMHAFGRGTFRPNDPFVQITFQLQSLPSNIKEADKTELRIDNVAYASPAFYVSPNGNDANDGLTEKTAFATPQKALSSAQPGDIILLMEGTYNGGTSSVASFKKAGMPDAWITLKNYPGQQPLLTSTGWNIVNIGGGSDDPSPAYLEIRGLHVRGEGDVAKAKYPDAMDKADPRTNSNGIAVDGRKMTHLPHHLRFVDNLVEYCPGVGIGVLEGDWVTIENNVCRDNCWTTIYAPSGISVLGASNFDGTDNVYRVLVRNNTCYRNETFEIWKAVNHVSDGNGIILDVNQKTDARPNGSFTGRTLVQSNLCFDNGGSGIHTVKANRVDIVNNTTYLNSASKALEYSEIFAYDSADVNIINNILVAPVANVAAGEKPEPVNISKKSPNVLYSHNIYFGGNIPPMMGEGDVIADPQFVNPSRDGSAADFHLKPNSPAIGSGVALPFGPYLDHEGKLRKSPPTRGAYEKESTHTHE